MAVVVSVAFTASNGVVGVAVVAYSIIAPIDNDCVVVDADVVADTAFAFGSANERREEI